MTDILLVEDQQELNKLMCTFLEKAGYQVKGVFSGEEALRFWEEEKAKETYEKIIELFPDTEKARRAQLDIDEMQE